MPLNKCNAHAPPPPPPKKKVMDDMDAHCLCLGDGKEKRDRGAVTRRLVLPAPHASLVVAVAPEDPRGVRGVACVESSRGRKEEGGIFLFLFLKKSNRTVCVTS